MDDMGFYGMKFAAFIVFMILSGAAAAGCTLDIFKPKTDGKTKQQIQKEREQNIIILFVVICFFLYFIYKVFEGIFYYWLTL